jgi:hypothetical protein
VTALASVTPLLPPHPVEWTSPAVYGPATAFITVAVMGATAQQRRRNVEDRIVQARQAMVTVRTTAQQAMAELRATLGLLRGDRATGRQPTAGAEIAPDQVAPPPRLSVLEQLPGRRGRRDCGWTCTGTASRRCPR